MYTIHTTYANSGILYHNHLTFDYPPPKSSTTCVMDVSPFGATGGFHRIPRELDDLTAFHFFFSIENVPSTTIRFDR